MTVAAAYQLNSVLIDTQAQAASPVTIGGLVRQSINTGVEIIKDNASGSLYPETAYVANAAPSASFTTTHCEELFDVIGYSPYCITSDADNDGFVMYARKLLCSGVAGSGNHVKYVFGKGVIVPMSLTCDHQGNASIDVQVYGVYGGGASGTNAALTATASSDIDTTTTVDTGRWTLYSVDVAGTSITTNKGMTCSFGNTPVLESADGDTSPTFAAVQETAPTISLRGIDPGGWWTAAGGLDGVACTHANTTINLKKRGVVVGSDAHIILTINGLAYSQQAFDASGSATGEVDITIEGTDDGTNAPLIMVIDPIS